MGGIWIKPRYEAAGEVFLEDGAEPVEVAEPAVDLEAERTGGELEGGVLLGEEAFVDGARAASAARTSR
jgi:hypothetical protein